MAIWQFQCNIIPAINNADRIGNDKLISWKNVMQPTHKVKFLEQQKSWSKDIIQYGKLEETCIEFIYDNHMLDEINCRLDLRSLTKKTLAAVVKYVEDMEAVFLVGDTIYLPKIEDIVEAMKSSEANQYCKNPMKYFLSIDETFE